MNQKITKTLFPWVGVGLALLVSGCHQSGSSTAGFEPPTVTVVPAATQELVETQELTGRVDPVESVEIRPRVSGYLMEIRFQSGQRVNKGDILFVIDKRPKQAALDRLTSDLERAKVKLEKAERDAVRATRLLASKGISKEEADEREWNVLDARAAIGSASAALETARLDLDFCEVRSPIDGRVSRALVTVGNNISGVDGFTTLMTTVVSVDPMYVYADVDEATLLRFRQLEREGKLPRNQNGKIAVELGLTGEEGFPHQGYIESFDNRVSADTGSILLRALIPNSDEHLVAGLFARLRVPVGERKPFILVNERAIVSDLGQKLVMTVTSSNTAAFRTVKLGGSVGMDRIIREGLEPGDLVIINGLQRVLQPGMPVKAERQGALAQQASGR